MPATRLHDLSESLESRINAAMSRGAWNEAEALCADLAGEYGNAGIAAMIKAMLDQAEELVVADQAALAERIAGAVAARDADSASALLAEKRARHGAIHQRHIDFMAELMDQVLRLFGEKGLERMLRGTGEQARPAMFDAMAAIPTAEQMPAWAKSLRNHLGEIEVTEDEEKFTIRQDPCGSGGRLMRAGRFDGEGALGRVNAPGLTLGVKNLPVYCSHCPVWMTNQHAEWYGSPRWVLEPPAGNERPCMIHFYKDKSAVPAAYRERLAGGSGERTSEEG